MNAFSNPLSAISMGAAALFLLAACASPQEAAVLAERDCFVAEQVLAWESPDGRSLRVTDSSGDHYSVNFCNTCRDLRRAVSVEFDPGADGRVCGDADEVVRVKGTTCHISSVMNIGTPLEVADRHTRF